MPAAIRNPSPLVSVLMPVYNGERHLSAALDSVLAQTFTDFELVLFDDGSTDRTAQIARRYSQLDPRVRVASRENRGLVATLNELLTLARGEFLVRMDADDVCYPDRLQRQLDFLHAHPEVVCVGGDHQLIDDAGRLLTTIRTLEHDADIQREALRGHGTICHPTATLRRSAIEQIGGYRAEFYPAEDLDLWLRLGEIGQLANLRGPLLQYRMHSNSISAASATGRQREAMLASCKAAWQRRGLTDGEFTASAPWRPGKDRRSQHQFLLRFGWWAFHSGERRTSAHYGWRAILALPWERAGWILALTSMLKKIPARASADRQDAS